MITMTLSYSVSVTLVFVSMLSLLSPSTETIPYYSYHICSYTSNNFTSNSSYQANLKSTLSSLSSSSTTRNNNGFYNVSTGREPNRVYGYFLCRFDVTNDDCRDCVVTASERIQEECPISKVAIIWYDQCMLRYSNQYFFSSVETLPSKYWNNSEIDTQPDRFMQIVGDTLNDLAARIANDQSNKKFATKEANFTSFRKLYSSVQCASYLSVDFCDRCLRIAIARIPDCCNKSQGGKFLLPSCIVRYEVYPFYKIIDTPPSSSTSPGGNESHTSRIVIIIVISTATFMTVIILICIFLRVRKPRENVGSKLKMDYGIPKNLGSIC